MRGMMWVMGAALLCTCRHAARSRSIYVGVQGNMDSRDCARNDEVGVLPLSLRGVGATLVVAHDEK